MQTPVDRSPKQTKQAKSRGSPAAGGLGSGGGAFFVGVRPPATILDGLRAEAATIFRRADVEHHGYHCAGCSSLLRRVAQFAEGKRAEAAVGWRSNSQEAALEGWHQLVSTAQRRKASEAVFV